jgi:hypothetical protein
MVFPASLIGQKIYFSAVEKEMEQTEEKLFLMEMIGRRGQ